MRTGPAFAALLIAALTFPALSTAGPKHCPPGHAKKGWCSPARQVAPPYRERQSWRRGERIPLTEYRVIENYYEYGWRAPLPGERYVIVDGRYYLIQVATGVILDLLLR